MVMPLSGNKRRFLLSGNYFWRYGAVAVFTIGIAIGLIERPWEDRSSEISPMAQQPAVLPGSYKAVLTLASGEQGNLEEWCRDSLWKDGTLIRKRKGELTYEQKAGDMQQEEMLFNTITIPRSGEYKLVLSDGTKVWLNSDSKLEFPNTFVGDERRVKLAGEAYFEVAKNKAKPFRVEVDRVEVVVLGTSFNIHAYDEAVKTTLVEGAVKLNVAGKAYSLSPGFEANVDQGGVKIVKSDVYEQIAWKDGRFVFREKRLEEVMSILSRWYDFEIFYQNAAVKDLHFTGNIPRHATINEVLKFLERTHLVHFSVVGRTVIVSE